MKILDQETGSAWVGVAGRMLAVLRDRPGASPGLSHFAPQVPTPADLTRFVQHYTAEHAEFHLVDHSVAHSCYVTDPDGHCVEVTCARPREEWRRQGDQAAVVADPMQPADFTTGPGADEPFTGLPAATEMGHVQFKVTAPGLEATEPCSSSPTGSARTEETWHTSAPWAREALPSQKAARECEERERAPLRRR